MIKDDWHEILKKYIYDQRKSYSWDARLPDYMNAQDLYDLLKHTRMDEDMTYRSYGYYDTRDRDVAKAALEALENGITLDQLIEKNSKVRAWYGQMLHERQRQQAQVERDRERRRKAAEKKKLEEAARAEAAAKLTPEELAAFGLTTTGKSKRK